MTFVEKAQTARSTSELTGLVNGLVTRFGFDYSLMVDLGAPGETPIPQLFHRTYPDAWSSQLQGRGGKLRCEPLLDWCRHNYRPTTWLDIRDTMPRNRYRASFDWLLAQTGVEDLYVCPTHRPDGRGALVMTRSRPIVRAELQEAHIFLGATVAYQAMRELTAGAHRPPNPLTERQMDVLRWAAAGKTYWDIATILGVSEQTVKSQLATTRQRLRAMTTTQAVAVALDRQYIRLPQSERHT